MNKNFTPTPIDGCYLYASKLFQDGRGTFSKIYSQAAFEALKLDISIAEVFYSSSAKNVLRGMHFQTPPHDQVKVVSCLAGRILDVVVDLRKNSPSFQKVFSIDLYPKLETTLVIPSGCAHGFYSYEDDSIVSYVVETNHNKEADQGVLWSSVDFTWPSKSPILSERDQSFPPINQFVTPF
jgi:dTDP-4-dehydrorhamnose 3,5-epimerase